jgi:hypothetical protein
MSSHHRNEEASAMPNAAAVLQGFQQALGKGDYAAARKLLNDRFSFQGPIDTFDRPDAYLESIKKLHNIIERIDLKKMFVDGDDVCMLYDMVTKSPAGTVFIAEWHRVTGDKIAAIRVVFDARPFAAMFGK